jgi:hypothetical protein
MSEFTDICNWPLHTVLFQEFCNKSNRTCVNWNSRSSRDHVHNARGRLDKHLGTVSYEWAFDLLLIPIGI